MFNVGDKVVITNLKGYNGTNVPPEFKEGFVSEIDKVGEGGWLGCYKLKGHLHYLSEHRIAAYDEAMPEPVAEVPVMAEPVEYAIAVLVIQTDDPVLVYKGMKDGEVLLTKKDGRWVQATASITITAT